MIANNVEIEPFESSCRQLYSFFNWNLCVTIHSKCPKNK